MMPATESPSADLQQTIRVLRSRKWEIALVTAVAVVVTGALTMRLTPIYRSTAQVLVESIQNPLNPYAAPQAPNLDTERQLVQSQVVASDVRKATHTPYSTSALLDHLSVSVITDTDVLSISYDDPNPATAASLANAFSSQYLRYRTQQAVFRMQAVADSVQAQIQGIQAKLKSLRDQINEVTARLASENGSAAQSDQDLLSSLTTNRQSAFGRLSVLQSQFVSLDPNASIAQSSGELLQRATASSTPASPNIPRNLILALAAGLALGIGFALLRERLDDRVKGREELERRLGAPVVAAIPRVSGWRRGQDPRLVVVSEPKSPVAEAYRTLATNVQYLASQRPLSMILITSAAGSEGKTTTAANLAVALAQTGRRIILVSADMRRPRLHQYFGIENGVGLSTILTGGATLVEAAVPAGIRNLRIIPGGPVPENPAGLLGGRRAAEFLSSIPSVADFILLDAPPTLAVADASVLAPRVDGTLYVIDAERSGRSAIQQARSQLENAGATLLGAVYNNFDPTKADSYAYYHSYYYAYYGIDQKHSEAAESSRNEPRQRARRERAVGFDAPLAPPVETVPDGSDAGVLVGTRAATRSGDRTEPGNGHQPGGGNGHQPGEGKASTDDGLPLWWASPEPGPS
jgi:capsular exopolysaccharide synthesis family protein